MEAALFYVLMGTGLRESEVVSLNVEQYRQKDCMMYCVINQNALAKNSFAPRE